MKSLKLFSIFILFAFTLSSCLTTQYKEYKFELTGKNSGMLTIKFVNIMSQKDDEKLTKKEEVEKDYQELVDKYIVGNELENSFPNARLVTKRLYEENSKLCGEIVFEFSDLSQVKLYKHDKKSPYMFYLSALSSEEFYNSNGKVGPDHMPIVFWDRKDDVLTLTTKVTDPSEKTTGLLDMWKSKQ